MPSINLSGDFVNGAIIAIIGLLAMQELSRIINGILAFFRPQVIVQRTQKSPFQVLLGFLKNVIILARVAYVATQFLPVYKAGQ